MTAPKRKKPKRAKRPSRSTVSREKRTVPFPEVNPRQRAFLVAYIETGGNVSKSATAARVSRFTHYGWLREEGLIGDRYRDAFEIAKELRNEALEDEATRRAHEGMRKYKFKRDGTPILHPVTGEPYCEHEYSDVLLIFRMKGAMPEKYRERHDHSGQVGGNPVNVNIQNNNTVGLELQEVRQQLLEDHGYLEYLRGELAEGNGNPSNIRIDDQQRKVADRTAPEKTGSSPDGPGSGANKTPGG